MSGGLGRRPLPEGDTKHLALYPLRAAMPRLAEQVERVLPLPYAYRPKYNQRQEGACVGFACSWAMSILNRRFYDARWLYSEAKKIDEWPGENYEGTSVRAGMDVLHQVGHTLLHQHDHTHVPGALHGISEFRWGQTVDEVRTCIASGVPVVLGIDWFSSFTTPAQQGREWWIGTEDLGAHVGGHAICCYGASDRRQAVKLVNSWGTSYALVWLPYTMLQRLLDGFQWPGECAVVVDRL